MKKNFIITVVCTVVFCAVGAATYIGMPKEQDSDLLLANVEALADNNENNPNLYWESKKETIYPVYIKVYDSEKGEYVDEISHYMIYTDCFGYLKGAVECYKGHFTYNSEPTT